MLQPEFTAFASPIMTRGACRAAWLEAFGCNCRISTLRIRFRRTCPSMDPGMSTRMCPLRGPPPTRTPTRPMLLSRTGPCTPQLWPGPTPSLKVVIAAVCSESSSSHFVPNCCVCRLCLSSDPHGFAAKYITSACITVFPSLCWHC